MMLGGPMPIMYLRIFVMGARLVEQYIRTAVIMSLIGLYLQRPSFCDERTREARSAGKGFEPWQTQRLRTALRFLS